MHNGKMVSKQDEVFSKAIVYGAMNDVSGKWYIGSTTTSLDFRRHEHYIDALKNPNPTRKFMFALREFAESDWVWGVHEEVYDITRRDLHFLEGQYQQAFDSVQNGYNCYIAAAAASGSRKSRRPPTGAEVSPERAEWNAYCKAGRQRRKEQDPEGYRAKAHEYYINRRQNPDNVEKDRQSNRASHARKRQKQREETSQ